MNGESPCGGVWATLTGSQKNTHTHFLNCRFDLFWTSRTSRWVSRTSPAISCIFNKINKFHAKQKIIQKRQSFLIHTPINTQSSLIGQLTHAWPSPSNNNSAAVLNQPLLAKLAARHKVYKRVAWRPSVMSQSHGREHWRGVSGAAFSVGERSFRRCGFWPFELSRTENPEGKKNNC